MLSPFSTSRVLSLSQLVSYMILYLLQTSNGLIFEDEYFGVINKQTVEECGVFCWDISRIGKALTLNFGNMNSHENILMAYNISKGRPYWHKLLEIDCETEVDRSILNVTKDERADLGDLHESLLLYIDVDESRLDNSTIYSYNETTGFAKLEMCVRIDLYIEEDLIGNGEFDSVTFHKTKLTINIDMIQGFGITINADRDFASVVDRQADLGYEINACQCNEQEQCIVETLTQNTPVNICLKNYNSPVMITQLYYMKLAQISDYGDVSVETVVDSVPSPFTTYDINESGRSVFITTRLVSAFFTEGVPSPVDVNGFVMLNFGSQQRRLFRVGRKLDDADKTAPASFAIQLSLQSEEPTTEPNSKYFNPLHPKICSSITFVLAFLSLFM